MISKILLGSPDYKNGFGTGVMRRSGSVGVYRSCGKDDKTVNISCAFARPFCVSGRILGTRYCRWSGCW